MVTHTRARKATVVRCDFCDKPNTCDWLTLDGSGAYCLDCIDDVRDLRRYWDAQEAQRPELRRVMDRARADARKLGQKYSPSARAVRAHQGLS